MEMTPSLVDPCVFYRKDGDVVVLITVCHVDDNAIAGTPEWMSWFNEGFKKHFGITKLG
jgi:hypothetical protein